MKKASINNRFGKEYGKKDVKKNICNMFLSGTVCLVFLLLFSGGVSAIGDSTYASGEVIVGYQHGTPPTDIEVAISSNGGQVVSINEKLNSILVKVNPGDENDFINVMKNDSSVRYAILNHRVQVVMAPNDPMYSMQYGPKNIKAEDAWNTTTGSKNVTIAIIDTGIDHTHEDLANNYVATGYDFVNYDNDPMDDHGHGTHCAGIAAAEINNNIGIAGLAQVNVMGVKVLNKWGYGWYWNCAMGIVYATDNGADIISMSWGGRYDDEMLEDAINYAHENGVFLVAAAGNTHGQILYPAKYDNVMAVSAINKMDKIAGFSSRGVEIEIAAPGVNIFSTVPTGSALPNNTYCELCTPLGYRILSGTSMAAPHVAGVAALILSQHPMYSNEDVRCIIKRTADDLGFPGRDAFYGYGKANAEKAVTTNDTSCPEEEIQGPLICDPDCNYLDSWKLSLAGYWKFDDNANDSSGKGNDGTVYGANYVTGKYGKALEFDGVNDYVSAGNDSSLSLNNAITIEAWVKLNTITATPNTILSKGSGNTTNYWMDIRSNGTIYFGGYTPTGDGCFGSVAGKITEANRWYHIAGTYDGSSNKIYVDGVLVNNVAKTCNLTTNVDNLTIGTRRNSYYFNGTIDEVAIYNRALTASEIAARYNGSDLLKLTPRITIEKENIPFYSKPNASEAYPGEIINYKLTVKNNGNDSVYNVWICDHLPLDVYFLSSAPKESVAPPNYWMWYNKYSNTVCWYNDVINASETTEIIITVKVSEWMTKYMWLNNSAQVTWNCEPTYDNEPLYKPACEENTNSLIKITESCGMRIEKKGDIKTYPGKEITYTIHAWNTALEPVYNGWVCDRLDDNVTFVNASIKPTTISDDGKKLCWYFGIVNSCYGTENIYDSTSRANVNDVKKTDLYCDSLGYSYRVSECGKYIEVTVKASEDFKGDARIRIIENKLSSADFSFVLDTTGSMFCRIEPMKDAIIDFTDELAASGIDYQLSSAEFGDWSAEFHYDGTTSDPEEFKRWMENLWTCGGGDWYESSLASMNRMLDNTPWRSDSARIMIMMTDAPSHDPDYDWPSSTVDSVIAKAKVKGVAIYPVFAECDYIHNGSMNSNVEKWVNNLKRMAKETKGTYLTFSCECTPDDISVILGELARSITPIIEQPVIGEIDNMAEVSWTCEPKIKPYNISIVRDTHWFTDVITPYILVNKKGPKKVYLGEEFNYTLKIKNVGAYSAYICDNLPIGTTYVNANPKPKVFNNNMTLCWYIDDLNKDKTITLKVKVNKHFWNASGSMILNNTVNYTWNCKENCTLNYSTYFITTVILPKVEIIAPECVYLGQYFDAKVKVTGNNITAVDYEMMCNQTVLNTQDYSSGSFFGLSYLLSPNNSMNYSGCYLRYASAKKDGATASGSGYITNIDLYARALGITTLDLIGTSITPEILREDAGPMSPVSIIDDQVIVTPCMKGDLYPRRCDGYINMLDWYYFNYGFEYVFGSALGDDKYSMLGDFDEDCKINNYDFFKFARAMYSNYTDHPCTGGYCGDGICQKDAWENGLNCPMDCNSDRDNIPERCDNCPRVYNPEQNDTDRDGVGNACDNCPRVYNPEQNDTDQDGVGDACDNCPKVYNPDQKDTNNNSKGDACDCGDGICYVTECRVVSKYNNTVLLFHLNNDSFYGESNTHAYDFSGKGNNGTIINGSVYTAGAGKCCGKALKFDGVNDYVSAGNDSSLSLNNAITVEAWVKLNAITSARTTILSKGTGNTTNYWMEIKGNGTIYFGGYTPSRVECYEYVTGRITEANRWYHIAGTYDRVRNKIYVDGVLVNDVAKTCNLTTNVDNLTIGT
ncbi:MAG: S8 family serine peptidase, partial [Candidatus Altarchaeum sp.]|nr:S8 family serine peptidase [Candidatus Altarchaeum sp.]